MSINKAGSRPVCPKSGCQLLVNLARTTTRSSQQTASVEMIMSGRSS